MGTPHGTGSWRARTAAVVAVIAVLSFTTACSDDKGDTGSTGASTTTSAGASSTTDGRSVGSTITTTTGPKIEGDPIDGFGDYRSTNYDDPAHWLCRPDKDDFCDKGPEPTSVAADGRLTPSVRFHTAVDAPVDCFYVYPTISQDQTPTSDWNPSPNEEEWVTLNQAAFLGSECRLFAPVYRQRTLAALVGGTSGTGGPTGQAADPYADVLDAFRTYLAEDNHGRGFVLIGHSQGAGLLGRLLREEIDGNEALRSHLVSAYLAGASLSVPEGKDVGGDLKNIPLCRSERQIGCVLSWATFRSTAPPTSASFFGRPGGRLGNDTSAGMVAACVNPADPGGLNKGPDGIDLWPIFPADARGSILTPSGGKASWLEGDASAITTPFVTLPELVFGRCEQRDGFSYLSITVHPDPGPRVDDVPGDLTPQWGMHLIDINVVLGNIRNLVAYQAEAYTG